MRNVAFWDWQYMGLLGILREMQPADKDVFDLFCKFRPVDFDLQHSFRVDAAECEESEFAKQDAAGKKRAMETIGAAFAPESFAHPDHPPLDELARRFALDDRQVRLVIFLFLFDRYEAFRDFFSKQSEFVGLNLLERYTGFARNSLVENMQISGPLAKCGILDEDRDTKLEISRYSVSIAVAQYISFYLDDTHSRPLVSFVLDAVDRCDLPLSAFDLERETVLSAMTALRRDGPGLLLFYGEPGTGKTELSKRLALDAGRRPCFLTNTDSRWRGYSSLCVASRLIDRDRDVLIVDEAEALLSTNKFSGDDDWARQKSLINLFLDEYRKKLILIVNSTWHISDSTLRRMHVLIGFKPLTCAQRRKVWGEINEANPVFSLEEQRQLSVEFPANPARIRQVQEICGELSRSGEAGETVLDTARDMLGRSAELLSGASYRKKRSGQAIDISLLNASVPVAELVDRIGRWNDSRETGGDGLNLLFYGVPGTGKTAFARHLVGAVGLPLVLKRASDLLDPYVGGTERKLREAFDEAKDCALVIDEADSFLTERSSAVRNWERTQVNEFLTCMESFSGLFIATTNFTSLLDAASRRRFHVKVEFFAPDASRRVALARHFFGRYAWGADDEARLARLEGLTPGDFDAVARRLRYAGGVDAAAVCEELERESGFKTAQRIGF